MRSKETLLERTHPGWIRIAGLIRRMTIALTNRALWQLTGVRLPDADGGATGHEVTNAEVFPGIGFYSRPPPDTKPEAITVSIWDANVPVVVATRDERTRAAVAGEIDEDETITFNSSTIVYHRNNRTVEIRTPGGRAVALALKSDVEAVDKKYAAHLHGAAGAPTTGPLSAFTPGTPPVTVPLTPAAIVGTTVLQGE
jgi:hypothetical protein